MKKKSISKIPFEFFVGNFSPSLLRSKDVEIAYRSYKKNSLLPPFYRKIDQEIVLITKGCVEIDNKLYKKGDILKWGINEKIYGFFKENTDVVIIRSPGSKKDYYQFFDNFDDFDNFYSNYFSMLQNIYDEKYSYTEKNTIFSEDVSVVVQGKVDKYTSFTIGSIKKYLPKAEIILSVWDGDDVSSLNYDKVVFNNDPGADFIDKKKKVLNNCNRQIVSSRNGCNIASRRFILKIRTDMVLFSSRFLSYFNREEKCVIPFFKSNILIGQIYSRNTFSFPYRGRDETIKTPFHPSDWFFFGLSDDIKALFNNVDLMSKRDLSNYKDLVNKKYLSYPFTWRYPPEQYIFINFLKKYEDICFDDYSDINPKAVRQSAKYMKIFKVLNLFQSGICNIKYIRVCFENSGLHYSIKGLYPFYKN